MFYIPYSICMFVKLRVSKRLLYAQQSLRQTGKQYVLYDLCAVHSPEGNDALSALSVNGQGSPSSSTSLHSDLTLVYHQVSPPSLLADLVDWPIQLIVDKNKDKSFLDHFACHRWKNDNLLAQHSRIPIDHVMSDIAQMLTKFTIIICYDHHAMIS